MNSFHPPRVAGVQRDGASFSPPWAAEVKSFSLADDAAASSDLPPAKALPQWAQLPFEALSQLGGTGDGRDATVLLHCGCRGVGVGVTESYKLARRLGKVTCWHRGLHTVLWKNTRQPV